MSEEYVRGGNVRITSRNRFLICAINFRKLYETKNGISFRKSITAFKTSSSADMNLN